ncbi:MAG: oligosaccharide flippase family protein [Bacteroidetes bacterium]|nr:oligosaccharide flippase family protein [Bacteroidota bacterium]
MKEKIVSAFTSINSVLNKGHHRSVKAKKNILASFVIKGCNIAISLILVPLTIHYVNPTQYGIWLTLSSIIGWFAFFDIGFGNGLRNKFAEALAKNDHGLARIYLSTTYAILSIIVVCLLLVFLCINPFLNWSRILNTPADMAAELSILALLVFVFFCLQFVLQLITTVITANQQPAKASFFNFLGSLFSLSIIFILTRTTSGNLIYLALSLGFTPVLVLTASSLWFYTHEYRKYAPSIRFVKFSYARSLMGLGLKFFIIQIAAVVLYETSNLIITQLFGPAQVTSYNVAYKYFGIIPMVMGIIMTPFWSAFTEAWVKQDFGWIKSTMRKLQMLWAGLSLLAVVMLLLSGFVYKWWVGKDIAIQVSISVAMASYVIINAWNGIYSQFLNGVGKIKLQLYTALAGTLVNIPLAIYLGKTLGIYGVVLSTTIISIMGAILSPMQYNKIIHNNARGIWAQ